MLSRFSWRHRHNTIQLRRFLSHKVAQSEVVRHEGHPAAFHMVRVAFEDGATANFHHMWLRDHCMCSKCYNSGTFQKEVPTNQIPLDIAPDELVTLPNGNLRIVWPGNHESEYAADFLRRYSYAPTLEAPEPKPERVLWGADAQPPTFAWDDVEDDNDAAVEWLQALETHGISRLTGVGTTDVEIDKVAARIGLPMTTFYGSFTTVEIKPNSLNDSSYSNAALRPHSDGTYWHERPYVQVFSCMRNDSSGGGESIFVDGFKVAAELNKRAPHVFEYLCSQPINFVKNDDERSFLQQRRVFELDDQGELLAFGFNNYDRGVCTLPEDDVAAFYVAIRTLMDVMDDPAMQLKLQMQPGEFWMLNNHRVCHGRTGFGETSARAVRTCYFSKEEFDSRIRLFTNNRVL